MLRQDGALWDSVCWQKLFFPLINFFAHQLIFILCCLYSCTYFLCSLLNVTTSDTTRASLMQNVVMWWIILKWENTDSPRRENEELLDSMGLELSEDVAREFFQKIVGRADWNSIRKCKWDNTAPQWVAKISWKEIRAISALLHLTKKCMHPARKHIAIMKSSGQ